jgi:hypothetical protein
VKKVSARKPPRRAKRKDVPMKFVTLLADLDGDKCIYSDKYITKLLAFARYARFSNISTPTYIIIDHCIIT